MRFDLDVLKVDVGGMNPQLRPAIIHNAEVHRHVSRVKLDGAVCMRAGWPQVGCGATWSGCMWAQAGVM